jgi:hypothetical protein
MPGKARLVRLCNRQFHSKPKPGTAALADDGARNDALLLALLSQDREGRPMSPSRVDERTTDVRLQRIWLETALGGGLRVVGDGVR